MLITISVGSWMEIELLELLSGVVSLNVCTSEGYSILFFFRTQDPQTNTYWMIYDNKTGQLTPLGVDQYEPPDDSVTVFRLVEGASHETATEQPSSGYKFVAKGVFALFLLVAVESLVFL